MSKHKSKAKSKRASKKPMWPIYLGIVVGLIVIAIFGVWLYGKYSIAHNGCETSQEAITQFIRAFDDVSYNDMAKVVHPSYSQILEMNYQAAKEEEDMLDIETENLFIGSSPYSPNNSDEELEPGTERNYVEAPAVLEMDGVTYYIVMKYTITTMQFGNRWYITDIIDEGSVVVNAIVTTPEGEQQSYDLTPQTDEPSVEIIEQSTESSETNP